jgi:transposase
MQPRAWYVGIDWGSEEHAICVMDELGKVVGERRVQNDTTVLKAIADLTEGSEPGHVHIGVETRRLAMVDALMARGYRVYSLNPKQADRFRDRYFPAGSKDDSRDAFSICSALRTDMRCFDLVEPEDGPKRVLRAAARTDEHVDDVFRMAANRLYASVLIAMPTLIPLCKGADEAWFWELLQKLFRSSSMNVSDQTVAGILKRRRITRHSVADIRAVLDGPRFPLVEGVHEATALQAGYLIDLLKFLAMQQKAATKAVASALAAQRKVGGKSDAEILMSMPGVGPATAAALIVEGHQAIVRGNLPQLRAVAGVAPVTQSTGVKERKNKKKVMMRRASSIRLRNAMHHAANTARRDPRFAPFYDRQIKSGASVGLACRVVADKMLPILVAMLRDRVEYRPLASTTPSSSAVEP